MLKSQGIISSNSNNVRNIIFIQLSICQNKCTIVELSNSQTFLSFKKIPLLLWPSPSTLFWRWGWGGESLSTVFFLLDWLIFLIVSGDVVDNFTLRIGFCLGLLAPTIIMTWNRISIMHEKNKGEGKVFLLGN